MTMLATVPAAKQASATTPSSTPEPMATRMSRPGRPRGVHVAGADVARRSGSCAAARALGSGGWGGLRRDAAAADAAAVTGDAARGATSAGSNSGS